MNSKVTSVFFLFAVVFSFGAAPRSVYGATPVVSAFTASPQAINYGYATLLSWTIANGTGHNLYFSCPAAGLTIKRDDGTAFPCNTKKSVSANPSDAASFYITNYTGNTANIPVKVIPLDATGASVDAAALSATITVGAVPNPITDFSLASPTVSAASTAAVLSWTTVEIGGVNLQFDCQSGIQIFSTNPIVTNEIKCGQPAYTADLPALGSAYVYFVNTNSSSVDETVRIFPAISASVYDATHARSVSVTIAPKTPPAASSIASFTSSSTTALSGGNVSLFWNALNTSGVNLQMPCGSGATWSSVVGTSTVALPCGVPGFSTALPPTGTTTVAFTNTGFSPQVVPISIFPQNADGTFDGTKARTVNITVFEPGHVVQTNTTQNITQNTIATTTTTGNVANTATISSGAINAVHRILFTTYLRAGSRGAQVSALQTFLGQDASLYPEGKVTGYLGPASVAAIKRFQERYNIAKRGDNGYGATGPKTRAKLNSMQIF